MAAQIPQRLSWAVEVLALQPAEQVLEIGCGNGVAVELVCERLDTGRITALDRSPVMIRRAMDRNSHYIASEKAVLLQTELRDADLGEQRFAKVFAVNVNVFWLKPAAELAAIRRVLSSGGVLYLFYHPPAGTVLEDIVERCSLNLRSHGFSVWESERQRSAPILDCASSLRFRR